MVKALFNNKDYQQIDFARKVIVDFYENRDLGKDNNLKKHIQSKELLELLKDKASLHQYVSKMYLLNKINYKIAVTLIEKSGKNSNYYLKFTVEVRFNYVDLEKVDSGYVEIVEIILNEMGDEYNILDFYSRDNYYDSFVRGHKINIVKSYEKGKNNNLLTKTIKDNQKVLRDRIDLTYEQDKIHSPVITRNNSIKAFTSLNKAAIVNYARNNFFLSPPNSGNAAVPYYDFSQIPNAYDCTNFVSHALLAGGATVYNTGNPFKGWYFASLSSRSYSWAGVPNLHDFLTTNTKKGPAGSSSTYHLFDKRYGYPYEKGDILQFHDGKVWRHSTIITGFYLFSGSYYVGALVTGRTGSEGAYNDNNKAEEVYPGKKRVIVLTGNYK